MKYLLSSTISNDSFLFIQIFFIKYMEVGGSSFPCVLKFSRMLLQSFWILKSKGYIRILSPCVGLLHPDWSNVTIIVASDWSILVTRPEYCPLIGQSLQSSPLIGSHRIQDPRLSLSLNTQTLSPPPSQTKENEKEGKPVSGIERMYNF